MLGDPVILLSCYETYLICSTVCPCYSPPSHNQIPYFVYGEDSVLVSTCTSSSNGEISMFLVSDHKLHPCDEKRFEHNSVTVRQLVQLCFLLRQSESEHNSCPFSTWSISNVHHTSLSSQLKTRSKVGHILDKVPTLRIMLNVDGTTISSRSHTHPSHTQNSLLLTSSLSLGVPGPRH